MLQYMRYKLIEKLVVKPTIKIEYLNIVLLVVDKTAM